MKLRGIAITAAICGALAIGSASPASAAVEGQTAWEGTALLIPTSLTSFDIEANSDICDTTFVAYPVNVGVTGCSASLTAKMTGSSDGCTGAGVGTLTISAGVASPGVPLVAVVKVVGGVGTYEAFGAATAGPKGAVASGTIAVICAGGGDYRQGVWAGTAAHARLP